LLPSEDDQYIHIYFAKVEVPKAKTDRAVQRVPGWRRGGNSLDVG